MAGADNLIPIQKGELSPEEAKQRETIGGIKSGEARREKKEKLKDDRLFKEIMNEKLNKIQDKTNKSIKEMSIDTLLTYLNPNNNKLPARDYIAVMTMLRDTIGEQPIAKSENTILEKKVFVSETDKKAVDDIIDNELN